MAKKQEDLMRKGFETYYKTVEQLAEDIANECKTRRGGNGYYCYCVDHYSREDLHLQIIQLFDRVFDEHDNMRDVPNGKYVARITTDACAGNSCNNVSMIQCENIQDAAYCLRLFLRRY